jgi:hypothetical protein
LYIEHVYPEGMRVSKMNLLKLFERSPSLRQFCYDDRIRDLESRNRQLKETIEELESKVRELQDAHDALYARADGDGYTGADVGWRAVEFRLYKHKVDKNTGNTKLSALKILDAKYNQDNRCYDRGTYCNYPYCELLLQNRECDTCGAKTCGQHGNIDYFREWGGPHFTQCAMCEKNLFPLPTRRCLVCDDFYNPASRNQWSQDHLLFGRDYWCHNREWHTWLCDYHTDVEIDKAVERKNHQCPLC